MKTEGHSAFIALNEGDFKPAWDLSQPPTAAITKLGIAGKIVQHNPDTFDKYSSESWTHFWEDWRVAE